MTASDASTGFQLLPWHLPLWQRIGRARTTGRLPHALLISGLPGIGKWHFARNIAHLLLCRDVTSDGRPCGVCRGCHLFQVGNHPDLHWLVAAADSKSGEITVDAVREMVQSVVLSSQAGGYKVFIVNPAEQLNRSAANALLKTLEEPAPNTLLMLLSTYPARLLPTLRSRCQHLPIVVPDEPTALAWLQTQGQADALLALRLAAGAPLAAQRLLEAELMQQRATALNAFLSLGNGKADPVALAESWLKQDLPLLFEWLSGWIADMVRLRSGHGAPRLANPDRQEDLARVAKTIDQAPLHEYWRQVTLARSRLDSNASQQLMLEALLAHWCRATAGNADRGLT